MVAPAWPTPSGWQSKKAASPFVKLGQVLATRRDLLPDEFVTCSTAGACGSATVARKRAGGHRPAPSGGPAPSSASRCPPPEPVGGLGGAEGDYCTPALPWGDLPVARFLARCRLAVAGDGLVIRYLDRADLIRMRRAAGRPKDLRRASELESLGPD